jgi:hypothetical protein
MFIIVNLCRIAKNKRNTFVVQFIIIFTLILIYICCMDVKEFLLTTKEINLTAIAQLMWPENKTAKTYLSKKLHGLDNRVFTDKDAELALKVLKDLGERIDGLKA